MLRNWMKDHVAVGNLCEMMLEKGEGPVTYMVRSLDFVRSSKGNS